MPFISTFTGNTAYTGGAILWKGSGGKITNTLFTDNSALVYECGAVFWLGADGEIIHSSFNVNTAYLFGGAVYVGQDSNLIIDASNFTDNLARSTKDVVYIRQYSKSCIIKNSIFNNSGPYEIYNNKILTLENNTLSKYIYNNGTILSKRYIVMPNNSTVEIYPDIYININDTITDDNGNIIIQD